MREWYKDETEIIWTTWNNTVIARNSEIQAIPVLPQLVRHNPVYPIPFPFYLV